MSYEHGHFIELEAKAVGDDGLFHGYASLFGVEDLGKDIVQPGAFAKSLKSRPAARIKMLREHDTANPIGVWDEVAEDGKGLRVKGRLILGTVLGRETHSLLKAGALDQLSIGYRTKASRMDRTKGTRLLDEVDLHEISIVTFAMLPSATVSSVKNYTPNQFQQLISAINGARANFQD